jgi:hypothetical protein
MILAPFLCALCCPAVAPGTDVETSGSYVEARTVSVFAGACHYGGERMTAGQEALLVWRIDSGTFHGVDLAGQSVAAAIVDEDNLTDAPRERRAVVYVPESATPAQRTALVAWADRSAHGALGTVLAVKPVQLSVAIGPETFSASASDVFDLRGSSLPDHACCKMPYQVWYEPFIALDGRLVGHDDEFRFREHDLARAWSRPGENAAFFGRFGPAPSRSPAAGTVLAQ